MSGLGICLYVEVTEVKKSLTYWSHGLWPQINNHRIFPSKEIQEQYLFLVRDLPPTKSKIHLIPLKKQEFFPLSPVAGRK